MKNIIHLLLVFTIPFLFFSCKENTKEIVPSSDYAPYVNAYTGGMISSESNIRVELTQGLSSVELNTEVKDKLFDFSPKLKGKTYWINNKTIEFVPDSGQLKQGKLYHASFKLGDVTSVSKELKNFEFSFRVAAQSFVFKEISTTVKSGSSELVNVSGEIHFSNVVKPERVKEMLSVKINQSQKPEISVEPTDNPRVFSFAINNIERADKDLELKITANGKSIGADKEEVETVDIPGKNIFRALYAKTIGNERNTIQVAFSDPISSDVDLRGLITISELSNYVFQVEDNKVNIVFEPNSQTDYSIYVYEGIKNERDQSLSQQQNFFLHIDSYKPMVEIPLKGNILPNSDNLILPFRAVSLSAVDLKIIRIFESNVLMFMQDNDLSSSSELRRSGRLIYKKTLRLDNDPKKDLNAWEDYSVDLTDVFKQEPGAIYRVELSFKQAYSVYPCGGNEKINDLTDPESQGMTKILSGELKEEDEAVWDITSTYYYEGNNYDWSTYRWEDEDNPCTPSYYMTSKCRTAYNLLASNVGVVVKAGSANKMWVAVNNILDTNPVKDAEVKVYNFQLQQIASGKTDAEGFAVIEYKGKPFVVVAQSGNQKTYLKVSDGQENSLSRFDIEGKEIKKGLKGYIYGERGVWRPGDTIHVGFVLEDKQSNIPDNHPVSIEIYNPKGQFYNKQVSSNGLNGFYTFAITTKPEDPTGMWNAYVKVGGATFHKSLRVETVKPNRLKINLNINGEMIEASKGNIPATITSSWLTGVTAGNLKTKVEMTLFKTLTKFKGYGNYIFDNPASDFYTNESQVFSGVLNSEGKVSFSMKVPKAGNAPGMLNANVICQVFEPGGDASVYTQSIPFSPFNSYVGVNLNEKEGSWIETDTDHIFDIVTLSSEGKPIDRSNLHYEVYKLGWSWWWENRSESFESYVNGNSTKPVLSGNLSTTGGKGKIKFRINYPEWGRYLVYVKDMTSGHASGGVVYVDWPDWRGRSSKSDPTGATMLTFSTDKKSYEVGEEVTVIIPASAEGRALLALENGSAVLQRNWIKIPGTGDVKYKFTVTEEMAPNFYVHISLLQSHSQTLNELPLRMYGVVPVFVTNKNSELTPVITMPDVLRPEKEFVVKVKEKNNKPMTYTLAVVDDGLLDLTNFKTPNPWNEFYAREALGIRTWDMYDQVIGAFGGKYNPLFSVGGDESGVKPASKANRFKPVVKFIGPFSIKGSENSHKITLPMYVGSVRVMVVAGQNGAYGNAQKTVPVRSPLMVLSTLPRVVSTGEEIQLPVNVFAMEKEVNNVTVKVETTGKLQLTSEGSKTMKFAKPGDDVIFFALKSNGKTGVETVKVTVTGGGQTATETIEIDVRNPNPSYLIAQDTLIGSGSDTQLSYQLGDLSEDNWVKLEVSRIPSVDISRRFDFLYDYPHYCSEQVTSRAFPLLYISQFKNLDKTEEEKIKENVREAIKNLYVRQMPNGGFVYWPGQTDINEWITSYAGNFLVEAQKRGYEVNQSVIKKWKDYQRRAAQNWSPDYHSKSRYYYSQYDLQQAYRLYTLALAGAPELGSMNRLKELAGLSVSAKWRLAAAYAVNGKTKAANEIIFNLKNTVEPYSLSNSTYGSYERDEAMILETMVLTGNMQDAFRQAVLVSKNLSRESYFSTQSTAFALVAMGRLAEKTEKGNIEFEWTLNGKSQKAVKSPNPVYQIDIPANVQDGILNIKNVSKGDLYISLVTKTKPVVDKQPAISNNLRLDVTYTDLEGKNINIFSLKQGTDFVANVKVSNISGTTDYTDLALTQIVPSGWEIFNERMMNQNENIVTKAPDYIYKDIRDDRVLTYFDLGKGLSKTFKVRLQATYAGRFILPAVQCEAMYDTSAQAKTVAGTVEVIR